MCGCLFNNVNYLFDNKEIVHLLLYGSAISVIMEFLHS